MAVEPFQWLRAHAASLGFPEDQVGPASVDLRLGAVTPFEVNDITQVVLFRPGEFYLASTMEYITVPATHCAMVNMRSSLARKGLGHKMAGFVDPGFEGQITLELETSQLVETFIGERIVQLIYVRLTEPTEKPYTGRYKGQRGPTKAYQA